MSIKKAIEFMEKNFEKFKPIKIDDKKLIKKIDEIRNERTGVYLTLRDLVGQRSENYSKRIKWFDDVIAKYKIPKKYEDRLSYEHKTNELTLIKK